MGDRPQTSSRPDLREAPALTVNPLPCALNERYVHQMRAMRRERAARLAAVRTRRQALAYQERVREAIARCFGRLPARTPLNARVTGAIDRPALRIEKVLFESRPGCLVSANLYLPRTASPTHLCPAVIADCGHAPNGKAFGEYQEFPQRLAAAGFVVLLIDPFAQGERDQYVKLPAELRTGLSDDCCGAHNLIGQQLALLGEFFGTWRAWDGIRGLDYLLSRPEVDARHVGVTGSSGGGTMTTWLWALEPRLTMAAPSCFVTTVAANLENQLPGDWEQCPPGLLAEGLELADFYLARAPQPSLLLGQRHDFFDRRGLAEAHAEIRRFHDLLGAPRHTHALRMDPLGHTFSRGQQEAMVDFFHRHAHGRRPPASARRETCAVVPDRELHATASGNVILDGGAPVYELIAERARHLAKKRQAHAPAALARVVADALGISRAELRATTPHHRVLRPRFGEPTVARYALESEGDGNVLAMLHKPRPQFAQSLDVEPEVTLYLPHVAAETEIAEAGVLGALYVLDARGLGESRPPGGFFERYGFDYMSQAFGTMFCRSLLGRRVVDVLRAIDLLAAEGARGIALIGRGQGAVLALYAGLLRRERLASVELRDAPTSYLDWATAPVVRWPAANAPYGALARFDLPEIERALGRHLTVVSRADALMQPVNG